MKNFIIVLLMLLAGCGTRHYKEFDFANVHENQGVIIGKVDVKNNAMLFDTTGCQFCAGSACQYLLEDGYVFMPVEKGPLSQGHLSCSFPGAYREDILFSVDSFEVTPGATYFGNLIFTVNMKSFPACPIPVKTDPPDYSDYEERKRSGEVTSHVDAFVKDSIDMLLSDIFSSDDASKQRVQYNISFGVSIEDGMTEVMNTLRGQVKKEDVEVQKNLFSIKLDKKERTFHRDC